MAVIIPCAGKSSRYPSDLPKFLRTLPNGDMLVQTVIEQYCKEEDVHIIILKEHDDKFNAANRIKECFNKSEKIYIHTLSKITSGPAETVYKIANKLNEPILIRDCDSFFDSNLRKDNYVVVADLRDFKEVRNIGAKSFVKLNNQSLIIDIFEKNIISNYFCCGGYGFSSSRDFCNSFDIINQKNKDEEIFISHVINNMLHSDVFDIEFAVNYIDLGTYEDYINFCQDQ